MTLKTGMLDKNDNEISSGERVKSSTLRKGGIYECHN